MSQVTDIKRAYNWSISKLAEAFDLDRATVRKRLNAAGVEPVGKSGVSPLYPLREAGAALFVSAFNAGPGADPNSMDPQSRRAWFQSENERLKFETEQRHVIPDDEVGREMAKLVKAIANTLDSLTDVLERECGMTGEQLEVVQHTIDTAREDMYQQAAQ